MSKKKNIDHFFKDRLEHLETAPPEMAWDNIKARLEEKDKKRILPFWLRLGGVAALLFLGLGWYTFYFNESVPNENPVVNQDTVKPNPNGNAIVGNEKSDPKSNPASSQSINNNSGNEATPIASPDEKTNSATAAVNENTIRTAATDSDKNQITTSNKSNTNLKTPIQKTTSVASNETQSEGKKQQNGIKRKSNSTTVDNPNSGIAANEKNKEKATVKNGSTSEKAVVANGNQKQSGIKNNSNSDKALASNGNKSKSNILKENTTTAVAKNDKQNKNAEFNSTKNNPKGIEKEENPIINRSSKSDLAVKTKESEAIKKMDSTKLAVVEPNALEELQNEKEKKHNKEQKINRWQVTPNVAPIYFSSLSNGSPLDQKLEENQKVYGTNFSYGVAVNYDMNKKFSVRTGVHSYAVDYDTRDIVYYQNTNASRMQNVDPTSQGAMIQIETLNHVNFNTSFGRIAEEKFEGVLNQKMSYIEVPFEVTYKLVSQKFGIDVIGGVSTLFLNQNDVFLKGEDFTMKIGEASNLNKMHFSTNIGLGLKYNFLRRFDARVEPLFKYQINTYSTGAGNFKPYVFGIYSGISYRF